MTQGIVPDGAMPDKGPVLKKEEKAKRMLLIEGQVGLVYFSHIG